MKNKLLRLCFAVIAFLLMAFIFNMSAQNAKSSEKISGLVIEKVYTAISSSFKEKPPEVKAQKVASMQHFARKLAHFSVYAALGLSVYGFYCTFQEKNAWFAVISAQLTGSVYAAGDEIHQLFVNGRGGQAIDVLLDSCGVLFGIIVLLLIYRLSEKIRRKRYVA